MSILDNRTLLVSINLIAIGSAITMAFLWREQVQRNGIGYWASGMAMIAIASLLTALRHIFPDVVSIIISNFLFVLGFQLILRGLRVLTGRTPLLILDYSLLPISIVLFLYFYYIEESQLIRIYIFSMVVAFICSFIVVTILTDTNKVQRNAGLAVATVFGLFAFFNFMRGLISFLFPSDQSVIDDSLSTTLLYISGIFFVGGAAVSLILQTYTVLASKLRIVSLAMDQSASSIVIVDDEGQIEYANPAALTMAKSAKSDLIGQDISVFCSGGLAPNHIEDMWQQLRSGHAWRGELHNTNKAGEEYWQVASIAPVTGSGGKVTHFVVIKEDITAIKQAEKQIYHLAHHDNLTGLPNRSLMMERLNKEISIAEQHNGQVALLFIDLDGFKNVNDRYGHAVGDCLLKKITQNLTNCVRETDTVARIGGDEFIVVLGKSIDETALKLVIERLILAASESFEFDSIKIKVSASIGISLYPQDSQDPNELIKLADKAMYSVKRNGKNNFAFATDY